MIKKIINNNNNNYNKMIIVQLHFFLQSETEWQSFQRHCLEIVAKLAELLPGETFTLLVMFVTHLHCTYVN